MHFYSRDSLKDVGADVRYMQYKLTAYQDFRFLVLLRTAVLREFNTKSAPGCDILRNKSFQGVISFQNAFEVVTLHNKNSHRKSTKKRGGEQNKKMEWHPSLPVVFCTDIYSHSQKPSPIASDGHLFFFKPSWIIIKFSTM